MRQNMRAERARLGMTAEQAAEAIGVHPNALRGWERGEAEPRGSNLVKLARLYHCSPDYLLGMTSDRTKGLVTN